MSLVSAPVVMALLSGAVKYAASIGDTHEPWGMPVFMGARWSHLPSRQIVASLFWRNE